MEERFSWIPFYSELAKALLAYKNDRKPYATGTGE
jgi:hypothetical protein